MNILVLLAAAAIGPVVALAPNPSFVPVALIGIVALATSSLVRVLFVVVGGLAAFQSTSELDALKLAYFGGAVIATIGSASAVTRDRMVLARVWPLLVGGLAVAGMIGISLVVASVRETPLADWFRDSAPYALFAIVPLLAVDASKAMTRRPLQFFVAGAGSIGALSFLLTWLGIRQFTEVEVQRFALQSFMLAALLMAFAVGVMFASRKGRAAAILMAVAAVLCVAATGTRSAVVLLVAPLATTVTHRSGASARLTRLTMMLSVGLLGVLVLGEALFSLSGVDATRAVDRLSTIASLAAGPSADQSLDERISQMTLAMEAVATSPLVGVGGGTSFVWRTAYGTTKTTFNIETGLAVLAKFGFLGALCLAFVVFRWLQFARQSGAGVGATALLAYWAITLAWLPFASPFEDKGFSLGLIPLAGLALREAADRSLQRE